MSLRLVLASVDMKHYNLKASAILSLAFLLASCNSVGASLSTASSSANSSASSGASSAASSSLSSAASSSSSSSLSSSSSSSSSSSKPKPTSSSYTPAQESHFTKEEIFAAAKATLTSPIGLDFTMTSSHYDNYLLANDYENRTGSVRYYAADKVYEGKQTSKTMAHSLNSDGTETGTEYLVETNEDWDQYYVDGSLLKNVLEYHSVDYGYGADWSRDTTLDTDSPVTTYSEWEIDSFHNMAILQAGVISACSKIEAVVENGEGQAKKDGATSLSNSGLDYFSYWEGVEGDAEGQSLYTVRYDVADSAYNIEHREYHIVVDAAGAFVEFNEIHTMENGTFIPYYLKRSYVPVSQDPGAFSGTRYVKPATIDDSIAIYYTDNSLPAYPDTSALSADSSGNIDFAMAMKLMGYGAYYSRKAISVKDVIETSATTLLSYGRSSEASVSETGVEVKGSVSSNFYVTDASEIAFYNTDKSAASEGYTQKLSVDSAFVLSSVVTGDDAASSVVNDVTESLTGYYVDDYIFAILNNATLANIEGYLPFNKVAENYFADVQSTGSDYLKSATKDAAGLITVVGYVDAVNPTTSPLVTVTFKDNELLSFDYSHVESTFVSNEQTSYTLHESATFTY